MAAESLSRLLSEYFTSVSTTEASCKNCQKRIKFSVKATSNLITHLKRCSPSLHAQYVDRRSRNQLEIKSADSCYQQRIKSFFQVATCQRFTSSDATQKALTKALIKSIACDQLPLSIVESESFRNLLLLAEPKFVIPSRSTIRNSLMPAITQQMEEEMRCEMSSLSHVYLTIDLWTNRNMTSFLGITVHFIDADWNLRSFILAADSFPGKHTACNIANPMMM